MKNHPNLHRLPTRLQSVPVAFPPKAACQNPGVNQLAPVYNVTAASFPISAGTTFPSLDNDFVFYIGQLPPCCQNGAFVLSADSPQGVLNVIVSETAPGSNTYTLGVQAAVEITAPVLVPVVLNYTDCNGNPGTLSTFVNIA